MRDRSLGIAALAIGMIVAGLYSQLAAFVLVPYAVLIAGTGSTLGQGSLVLGLLFAALSVASYALAYAFWTHGHWAWTGATVVLVALIGASVGLAIVSTNVASAAAPSLGAAFGIWYMHRPIIRGEVLGGTTRTKVAITASDAIGIAGTVH